MPMRRTSRIGTTSANSTSAAPLSSPASHARYRRISLSLPLRDRPVPAAVSLYSAAPGLRSPLLPSSSTCGSGHGVEVVCNRLQDVAHVRAYRRQGADRHDRDQDQDQGVLDEPLTLLAIPN